MKRFAVCSCAFIWLGGLLQAQLSVPQPGFARFSNGSIHLVHGLAANFIVGPRAIAPADGASFSDAGGLTSSQGLIRLVDADAKLLGEYRSDEPVPILNIDGSLQSAVVWLPARRLLLTWNGKGFTETYVDDSAFGGRVAFVRLSVNGTGSAGASLSPTLPVCAPRSQSRHPQQSAVSLLRPDFCLVRAAASASTAEFYVMREDSSITKVTVSLPAARLLTADIQPGVHGEVFVQQSWLLWQEARGLAAELPNGAREMIELSQTPPPAGDFTIERMSNDWLNVSSRSTGTHWAAYLHEAKWIVSLLPPPVRGAAR